MSERMFGYKMPECDHCMDTGMVHIGGEEERFCTHCKCGENLRAWKDVLFENVRPKEILE